MINLEGNQQEQQDQAGNDTDVATQPTLANGNASWPMLSVA